MAARIIANLIVAGAGVLIRAGAQAYRQAIVNGTKAGVASEGTRAAFGAKQMSLEEASRILGVDKSAPLEEVVKKYNHLFEINEKHGSFYLQSKVFRAKERMEQEHDQSEEPDNSQ